MKKLLVCLLFSVIAGVLAFETCSSEQCEDSCKNRCGEKPNKSYSCQCNVHCERFGDCCKDYSICNYIDPELNEVTQHDKSDTSCQGRCGQKYKKNDPCHCNKKCAKFNNCCSDYDKLCSGGPSASTSANNGGPSASTSANNGGPSASTSANNGGPSASANSASSSHHKDTSCQGRCGQKYKKNDPCHCNKKCVKFNNCCSDYDKLCSGGASASTSANNGGPSASASSIHHKGADISNEEIKMMSEKLYKCDVNKAADSDIVLNKQEMASSTRNHEDLCEEPLYQYVNEEIFKRPTFAVFISLLDNYDRKTGTDETHSAEEMQEQKHFLQEIMKTKVMKELYTFFHQKDRYKTEKEFADDLQKMWFGLYSRSTGEQDSSGFEHVFVGEVKKGKVSGFHSWIRFYLLEKKGLMNYHSHNFDGPWTNYPDVLGKQFNWDGFNKEVGTQFIGSSPEFDFAIYTLCFISRPGKKCQLTLGGHNIAIQTYEWTKTSYDKGKKFIATAYPTV